MSWLYSRALVEAYLEENSLDGTPSVQLNGNLTPQAYLSSDKMKAFSRLSRSGMTFAPLTEDLGRDLLTWYQEVFLAKTYPQQTTMGKESKEKSQDSGQKCLESFAKLAPSGYWLKTQPTSEPKALMLSSKAWPKQGMML